MSRKIVPLVTDETYHIYNRGVDKRTIFKDKADYFRFHLSMQMFNSSEQSGSLYELRWKKDWIHKQKPLVRIESYCLLGNHYHLLLTQVIDGGISEFMKRLSGGYTNYFNERYKRTGSLFQGRFKRVFCESNEKLLYLAAYINLNNKVHNKKSYFLSSMNVYTGTREELFVHTDLILSQYKNKATFELDSESLVREIVKTRKVAEDFGKSYLLE